LLCLRPGRVLMADDSPRTAERLAARGVEVVTVPYGEVQKNGGGVHCSTMELVRSPTSSRQAAART
ncbi:MAG TPA: arginine deiminase family protein, partial [Baekduia sp.]|nr:arginine deiminase family protein [Baekduia sp.]